MTLCILTCNHLRIYIRLGAVQVGVLLFTICRSDLAVVFECLVAVTNKCLCTDDPCVVVAEDTSIFLIAARISRNFTVLDVVLGECRLVQNQTVCRIQILVYALQSLQVCAGLLAAAAHNSKALRFDEDLALFALVRAHLLAEVIIRTQEPFAVPAVIHDVLLHLVDGSLCLCSTSLVALLLAHSHIFRTSVSEQRSNHHRLCNLGILILAVLRRSRGLEGFARLVRETGQVDAVVPVCTHCQRQSVRANVFYHVEEALLQVIHHGLCLGLVVVIRYHSVQDGVVAGFLDVCSHRQDHPQRIVGEVAADLVVALLGQRLILVIASAVFQLCRCQVDQTLSCSVRNLVYKAQQVLVGVTESHATADTALEVRCRTGHIKGDHALILIPDVDHAVHLVIRSLDAVLGQQCIPHCLQFSQCSSNLFRCVVLFDHLVCTGLVHAAVSVPLLILRVFYIAQNEDQLLGFARSQCDFLIV